MMRRFAGLLVALILAFASATQSFAASEIHVVFDGEEIQFDAAPFVEGGRTLVPLRALAEALGFTVGWDEPEEKVVLAKGDTTMALWIGSTRALINGAAYTLDVPPKKVGDRTFVPLRFVAERLGAQVAWDAEQQRAVVKSDRSLLAKLNLRQKLADQKTTGDFETQLEIMPPYGTLGDNINIQMPTHVELLVYQNDLLLRQTLSMGPSGQPAANPFTTQIAVKDGTIHRQSPVTLQWRKTGTVKPVTGVPDWGTIIGPGGMGQLIRMRPEVLQATSVSVAGQEEIDGVQTVRVDADLSKAKLGDVLERYIARLVFPSAGENMTIKINVDRYLAHYWINPDTVFVHKATLDMAISITVSDDSGSMAGKVVAKGELRSVPISAPIDFPNLDSVSLSVDPGKAAVAYWEALAKSVAIDTCFKAAFDTQYDWSWKKSAGPDASAKTTACFAQQRSALNALTPPADFADAQAALAKALEASEKASDTLTQAFELAIKGDKTASEAKKREADKLKGPADKALILANMQMAQAMAKYYL